jgi:hypothetical protein
LIVTAFGVAITIIAWNIAGVTSSTYALAIDTVRVASAILVVTAFWVTIAISTWNVAWVTAACYAFAIIAI